MEFPNVNLDNFGEHIDEYKSKRSASVYNSIPFMETFPNSYPSHLFDLLNEHVDRVETLEKFTKYTKNMDLSNELEAGVYEFALSYAYKNDLNKEFISSIYRDKTNEILENFDKNTSINNKTLLKSVLGNEIKAQEVAYMSPKEMCPENWKVQVEKRQKIEHTREHKASTNMYKCHDCGERKCIIYQMQTRSSDEGFTVYATCLVCYKTFKVG